MFQFDDILTKALGQGRRAHRHRRGELFYTCVEMQRVCILFNQAHDDFLEQYATPASMPRRSLQDHHRRCKDDISSTLFAFSRSASESART